MSGASVRRWWRALRWLAVELGAGLGSFLFLFVCLVISPLLVLSGGWLLVPVVVVPLRRWADLARERTARRVPIESAYSPIPPSPSFADRLRLAFSRSTGRDLVWLLGHGTIAPLASLLSIALPFAAVNALLVPAYWYLAPADDPISSPFPVTSWGAAAWSPLVAIGYALLAWWVIPGVAFVLRRAQARILSPSHKARLAARVTALTASRAAALDAQSAELRRIERDLHDGAQNRLVNVVMMLGIAERSLETNPDDALPQLQRAQEMAMDALSGLRTAVHDIYPPILDELGLECALAAVAGRSAVPCSLDTSSLRRVPAAVESAAYFVVAEAVTNLNKYSRATRALISVESDTSAMVESVRIVVEDDGVGGAHERPGGGIAGIRRRAEAFEGTLQLTSPQGGPTNMRVELPCGW
ncbi:sensor histidine kinase [Microbacterium protaetiae]|uniref:histidine kinase n=1 Tax=Microbacterium protaetiae TaxID=2509458 RepID=A0A4P6E9K4_9MICO|nr:sensor histidine kinase [Microbacterium protaetiae]QAY58574.1 sensor histidine kinase [Microbacterium protaetiae]